MSGNDDKKQQPQQQQPQQQQPFEMKPGDDTCRSCTGVLYYTKEMREKGQKPVCFGASSTLKYRVSEESMKRIDENRAGKRIEEVFMCIGYSRTSGRMERKGQTPACMDGIAIARYPELPEDANSKEQEQPKKSPKSAPVPVPPPLLPQPSLATIDEFADKFQKSAVRNVEVVSKFWEQSLTNFPEKLEKSSTRIANSMAATPSRIGRAFNKVCGMLFGDDDDA